MILLLYLLFLKIILLSNMKKIISLIFLLITVKIYSQNTGTFADKKIYLVDSLDLKSISKSDLQILDSGVTAYRTANSDTSRIKQLGFIANTLSDAEVWIKYAFLMRKETQGSLAKKNADVVQKRLYGLSGTAAHFIGYYYLAIARNDSVSAIYNLESLEYFKKAGRLKSVASAMTSLAGNYGNQGKVKQAMDFYQRSLKIYEELKDTNHIAQAYQNIGYLLQNQNDIAGAYKNFSKALNLYTLIHSEADMADCYSFIGTCYKSRKMPDSAIVAFDKAFAIFTREENEYGIATVLLNKGELLQTQGKLDEAEQMFEKSLSMFEKFNDKNPISFALNSLAIIYYKKGEIEKARIAGERSLALARDIHYPDNIRNAAKVLSRIYKNKGNYKDALQMHELYSQMNDSILNADTKRNAIEKELKYQHDKELLELQKEREKETLSAQKEKEKRNIVIVSVSIGLLLALIFFAFLYNRFILIRKQKNIIELQKAEVETQKKEVENQKELVETKNHEIVDSIRYAKRLQNAILPQKKLIAEYLPDSFVYYRPKDIVAGDFYWFEKVGDDIIFAVADCTGHGVPGAMVSFVCVNALNRSVLEFGLTEPAAILDKVSELVVLAFNRSEDEVKDGMDISLCVLNTKTNLLRYAGAYNPVWILRKASGEMEESGATRQAIGNIINPVPFANNIIPLEKGDTVYLFSDGYADQFGGPKGKKLKYSSFKKILSDNNSSAMNTQAQKLDEAFESWMGALEQVDDICVIGVRVS